MQKVQNVYTNNRNNEQKDQGCTKNGKTFFFKLRRTTNIVYFQKVYFYIGASIIRSI